MTQFHARADVLRLTYLPRARPGILRSMLIKLRLSLHTVAESATFTLDCELPAVPAVGDELDLHPMCGPFVVLSVREQAGATICEVDEWDCHKPARIQPLDLEHAEPILWELVQGGWKRET